MAARSDPIVPLNDQDAEFFALEIHNLKPEVLWGLVYSSARSYPEFAHLVRHEIRQETRRQYKLPDPLDYDECYQEFKNIIRPMRDDRQYSEPQLRELGRRIWEPLRELGWRVSRSVNRESSRMEAEEALSCLFAMMHTLSELKITVLKLLRHRGKAWREKGTVLELLINRISEVVDIYKSRGGRLLPYMRASLDSWLSRFDNLCSFEYIPWIWEVFWDDPDFQSYDPDHEVMLGLERRLQDLRKRKPTDYEDDECDKQEEKADEEGNESHSTRGGSLTLGQVQKRITSFRTRFGARGG